VGRAVIRAVLGQRVSIPATVSEVGLVGTVVLVVCGILFAIGSVLFVVPGIVVAVC